MSSDRTRNPETMQPLRGIVFRTPAGLVPEEFSATYRGSPLDRTVRPTLSQVAQIRPTFMVQRRLVAEGTLIEEVSAATTVQLLASIKNIGPIVERPFRFDDGATGVLLQYSVAALPDLHLMNLLAIRLDGKMVTTLSIASAERLFSKETREAYEACLSSASKE